MATIGYSTAAANNFTARGQIIACRFAAPSNGDANTGTLYLYGRYVVAARSVKTGVWADNAGNPGALLVEGPTILFDNSSVAWKSGSITWTGITAGTYYWLGGIGEDADSPRVLYDTGGATNQARYTANTGYPNLPDPFPSATGASAILSVYVEYTEAASGLLVPIGMHQLREQGVN